METADLEARGGRNGERDYCSENIGLVIDNEI